MSDNIVDLIRERTDEQDINSILKSTMGGYTKKSVLDYLAQLKRQQQNITNTFNQNMQSMLEEKDQLQSEKAALEAKLTKTEADYHDLNQSLVSYKLEGSEYSLEDVLKLKGSIAALEKDMDEAVARINLDGQTIEQQNVLLQDKDTQIQKSAQETKSTQEQLVTERGESSALRKKVSALSQTITELRDQVAFLKKITSDGVVGELNTRISELLATVDQQQSLIHNKDEELAARADTIDSYMDQSTADRTSIEHLAKTADALNLQVEKLQAANRTLAGRLKAALDESMQLAREKSDLSVEKAVLTRKLESTQLNSSLNQIGPLAEQNREGGDGPAPE